MISARGIKKEQRVTGRRGIHHDEPFIRFPDDARKRLEHRDLFRAGGAKIFFEKLLPGFIEPRSLSLQDESAVILRFLLRINPGDRETGDRSRERRVHMRRGV